MRKIRIESPAANGVVSFHVVSNRTGKSLVSPDLLTPDIGLCTVDIPDDDDVSVVWRRLGNATEVRQVEPGAGHVVLGDDVKAGPVIAAIETLPFTAVDSPLTFHTEGPFAERSVERAELATRRVFQGRRLPGAQGVDDIIGFSPGIRVLESAGPTATATAKRLMARSTARKATRESKPELNVSNLEKSLNRFSRKEQKRSASVRSSAVEARFIPSKEGKALGMMFIHDVPEGPLSVGVASDTSPFKYGGWKPYHGEWPIHVHQNFGRLTFEIPPAGRGPQPVDFEAGAKVRFTVAAINRKSTRFLVPLYSGGTRVTLTGEGLSNYEVHFDVEPSDSRLRVVIQSLVVANERDVLAVSESVKKTANELLPSVRDGSLYDPWAAIVLGLAIRRHKWDVDCSWCQPLAARFPWIPDALVLTGWWFSTKAGGRNLSRTVELLSQARRLGAVYFAESNSILRDLLVWLSSDGTTKAMRALAKRELGLWRSKVPFQSWSGATFAWVVERSNLKGEIDPKNDLVLYKGQIGDLIGSTDPNKGRFGGRSEANGRRVKALIFPTDDREWYEVEVLVESLDGTASMTGNVEFHLHPTYPSRIIEVQAEQGKARLKVPAWGAFTVGVVADEGKTRLELDLSTAQGATTGFTAR
ncbi:hypothetical protein OVA03_07720 [Asticcacaulis sp. SL142]|uniref:pYEATS domain-containing protein n=1 Tax=Asticcacaulis sp. SL142 TaxID=2995155 RepID=UPI00226CA250|nr:pYEATS domain-containing protein [Asticcacaulis sp. SL142]WAC49777.1 hypothetical protein OVA03_07720 [Asticcacaulis sp. SL142]